MIKKIVISILVLGAYTWLCIDYGSRFKIQYQSPIVMIEIYDKDVKPRVNSMADLNNGSPIQDETVVDEVKPIALKETKHWSDLIKPKK